MGRGVAFARPQLAVDHSWPPFSQPLHPGVPHAVPRIADSGCPELDAARPEAADARALAEKLERDLQDLSGAYAGLEAHAATLERRVAELAAQSAGSGGAWWWVGGVGRGGATILRAHQPTSFTHPSHYRSD